MPFGMNYITLREVTWLGLLPGIVFFLYCFVEELAVWEISTIFIIFLAKAQA
jgi:hypothetical protein